MSLSAKSEPEQLITDNLDIWAAAIENKGAAGRGSKKKQKLYGIRKLRELILELAVRGLLVPQDPNDEPASVLLEKIAAEKELLVKEGKIKKQKKLPPISDEEKPFELPKEWEHVRWGEMAIWAIGSGFPHSVQGTEGEKVLFSKVSDMNLPENEKFIRSTVNSISYETAKKIKAKVHSSGTVIFPKIGGAIATNKRRVLVRDTAIDNNCLGLTPCGGLTTEYLFLILSAVDLTLYQSGTSVPALSQSVLSEIVSGLPPEAEQPRIVAKVDELMALCDQLEQQTESSLNAHQTLVETLLKALLDAAQSRDEGSSKESAFEQAWQRIADHFDILFTTEHSIDQLKQTILQLAVMGKLVPQDPNDEPASVLLEKIAAEKERLVKEGKIKKQKKLPPISDEEKPFELPEGWLLVRLGELADEIATGPFGSMVHKRDYIKGGIPLINPSHMINGRIVEDESVTVSKIKASELNSHKLREGDLVMARRGEMGRSALVSSREESWLCGTGSFVLRFNESVDRDYLLLLFKTDLVRDYLGGNSVGITMTNLNHTILNSLPLLIPPKTEMVRIFSKIDELMTICDSLKVSIRESKTTQLHLADAMAKQALH